MDRRWRGVHLFVRGEANAWRDERDDGSEDIALAANLGLGIRFDHASGRLRSSAAAGPSFLLVPTDVDDAPTAGLFIDLRPLAVRWPAGEGLQLGVVPLSLTVAVPVLTGIPLVCLQYRTSVFLEPSF